MIYPRYIEMSWEEFESADYEQELGRLLSVIPLSTVLALCRRNLNHLYIFLHYFDDSQIARTHPKMYLPYLCHIIYRVPVQWIILHVLKIIDVRYAFQLANSAFCHYFPVYGYSYEYFNVRESTWKKFISVSPGTMDISVHDAWNRLTYLRSSMRELMENNIEIRLCEYIKLDKMAFVQKLLHNSTSMTKYVKLLNSQIIPYCNSNRIQYEGLIVETIARKEWPVTQKLKVVHEYIYDLSNRISALEKMTFSCEEELETIRKYASSNGLIFEPDPINYIKCIESTKTVSIVRSSSNDSFSPSELMGSPCSVEKTRRAPSYTSFSGTEFLQPLSISSIANGKPNNPTEYAKKLYRFRNLKEIGPIYQLAEKFSIVVCYSHIIDIATKGNLFVDVFLECGIGSFSELVSILELDPESIINHFCNNEKTLDYGIEIMPQLCLYLTRSNWPIFLSFITKSVKKLRTKISNSKLALFLMNCLCNTLPFLDGPSITDYSIKYCILKKIVTKDLSEEISNDIIIKLVNEVSGEQIIEGIKNKNIEDSFPEIFINSYIKQPTNILEDDLVFFKPDRFFPAIRQISLMDSSIVIPLLVRVLGKTTGTNYSLLHYIYYVLYLNGMNYEKDRSIITLLYHSSTQINFGLLMKDPKNILINNVNSMNIYSLLAIARLIGINEDDLLIQLMVNVKNSTQFNDYAKYISLLKKSDSLEPVHNSLINRFKYQERVNFLEALGLKEERIKYETRLDLVTLSLNDFDKNEYLNNPSKMICEIYSKISLHEKFGQSLHELVNRLSSRFGLSITKIREHLLNTWLNENEHKHKDNSSSVFSETFEEIIHKEDQLIIQKILFILRVWPPRTSVKWLLLFIFQKEKISYRSRFRAISALFLFADQKLICSVYQGEFQELVKMQQKSYYMCISETIGLAKGNDLLLDGQYEEFLSQMFDIDNYDVFSLMLVVCIDQKIFNYSILSSIINKMVLSKDLILIKYLPLILDHISTEDFFSIYVQALSSPFREIINKEPQTKPIRSHHLSVIRDTLDSISICTKRIPYLLFDDKVNWTYVAERLCETGFSHLAAEIGSHLYCIEFYEQICDVLLNKKCFDDLLQFGFDENVVFSYIIQECTEEATHVMIDEHFVRFTAWVHQNNHKDILKVIEDSLLKQGRTMEVKRMKERLLLS